MYLKKHHPEQQANTVNGVIINPVLRDGFNDTPNEERDPLEIEHWFGRSYIVTDDWSSREETWEDHVARLKASPAIKGWEMPIPAREEYDKEQAAQRESWFNSYPTGIRYEIRCLDGGAWDRSSLLGYSQNLEEAIKLIGDRDV